MAIRTYTLSSPDPIGQSGKPSPKSSPKPPSRLPKLIAVFAFLGAATGIIYWSLTRDWAPPPPEPGAATGAPTEGVMVVDDSELSEDEYRERHSWFFDNEQAIMKNAPARLKTLSRPEPELWQTTKGQVTMQIRNVKWVPVHGKSTPPADAPVVVEADGGERQGGPKDAEDDAAADEPPAEATPLDQ
jgi:hypothetical protein